MQELQPGDPEWFGAFIVVGRLGAGGMGTSTSPSRPEAAVSRSRRSAPIRPGDPPVRERFRREVDAARRVSGFWTAPVVDADPDAATPGVAIAYLDAPELGQHVQRRGRLPAGELQRWSPCGAAPARPGADCDCDSTGLGVRPDDTACGRAAGR
jgi:hypothetical protein